MADLVARFRAGDESAVRDVYQRYGGAIQTVARSMTRDPELVAEIVQQTFVKAWRASATFEEGRDLAPWLYTIARRTAIDALRREMRPTAGDHDPEVDVAVTTLSFERTWEIHEVRRALDGIPVEEREVVRLSHLVGLSHPEIADRMGIPVGESPQAARRRVGTSRGSAVGREPAGRCRRSGRGGVTVPDEPFDTDPGIDADLAALLAEPALWEPADAGLEDAVVAAIAAESASSGVVVPLTRSRHRLVAAAAAVVLVVLMVGAVLSIRETSAPGGIELALEATELAPAATGVVSIDDTPFGTRLVLAVSGLPPAAADQYYEAWLRTGPEVGVSAGTFHLRGGDGEIELWAGVTAADYPLFTITIQDEADAESSGRVVLKGRVAE